jgi:general secretion pathway protein H
MMRARRGGFTLIEMIVVLMILAVATAVTVPALRAPPVEDDFTIAMKRVDDMFRFARDSSVRAGLPLTIAIDSATGNVWLLSDEDSSSGVAEGEPLDLPVGFSIELTKARARFRFLPSGAAFADSLTLRSNGATRIISVDPWSGRAVTF